MHATFGNLTNENVWFQPSVVLFLQRPNDNDSPRQVLSMSVKSVVYGQQDLDQDDLENENNGNTEKVN